MFPQSLRISIKAREAAFPLGVEKAPHCEEIDYISVTSEKKSKPYSSPS